MDKVIKKRYRISYDNILSFVCETFVCMTCNIIKIKNENDLNIFNIVISGSLYIFICLLYVCITVQRSANI